MNIEEYINQKKTLYALLIQFIEEPEIDDSKNYQKLANFIKSNNILNDKKEFKDFLCLLVKLIKYHHVTSDFFPKIFIILSDLGPNIKQNFSNLEIHNLFKRNKLVLLHLIKQEIITFDKSIFKKIFARNQIVFFYPEAKTFMSEKERTKIELILTKSDANIFDKIETIRQRGENESYLAELIRNDSVSEFITYVNQTNLNLNSCIKPSFFENNLLLKNSKTTLIEYAAFFGSLQIIRYLQMNKVKMESSLWIYAIHSDNPDLIHFLEEMHVHCEKERCLEETIKCHHNRLANYFITNLIGDEIVSFMIEHSYRNLYSYCFHYLNFEFFPKKMNKKIIFYNACNYDFLPIVKYLLETTEIDLNATIIH